MNSQHQRFKAEGSDLTQTPIAKVRANTRRSEFPL